MAQPSSLSNWELNREPDCISTKQLSLPLLGRLDAPSVAPAGLLKHATTYRQACQIAWAYRRIKGMTARSLAEMTGMHPPHISEYLSDDDTKREMPARYIPAFEVVVGNTAVSQWLAKQSQLTVLEEVQANARAA